MSDLVTGASSGLGQFLARQLGATAGTRESLPEILSGGRGFDRIIHCASVSRFDSSLSELTESNIELTDRLLNVSHKRFVFISTIDVYPDRPGNRFDEDFELPDDLNSYRSAYAWSKAMAEKLVLNRAQKPLVLRWWYFPQHICRLGVDLARPPLSRLPLTIFVQHHQP